MVVLMWLCMAHVRRHLRELTAHTVAANAAGCVLDKGWAAVLSDFVHDTDLNSLHTWLGWLLGVCVLVWMVGAVVTVKVLRELSAL
jgi:hypothetical protein